MEAAKSESHTWWLQAPRQFGIMGLAMRHLLALSLYLAIAAPLQADVELPALFGDRMVIQRDLARACLGKRGSGRASHGHVSRAGGQRDRGSKWTVGGLPRTGRGWRTAFPLRDRRQLD